MSDSAMQAWRLWWDEEGSAMRPLPNEDTEQFARRMTEIAWSNGAFKRLEDVEYLCLKRVGLERELAAAKKQRDEAQGQTWYLLYGGSSVDGSGTGHYIGRTTDKEVARKHHAELRKSPYNIGYVEIVTDTAKKRVSYYGRELETKKEGGGA